MAKSTNRGGGTGTYDRGGVRCTLDAPFKQGANKGSGNAMRAPFDQARTGGDNNLPTTVYDDLGGPSGGANATSRDSLDTVLTNPRGPRR